MNIGKWIDRFLAFAVAASVSFVLTIIVLAYWY